MSWFSVDFIPNLVIIIFWVKPKCFLVWIQEEAEIKLGVDSKYAMEEESG